MKSITNQPVARPTYVEVDLDRLRTNYQAIKQAVGRRGIIPVVKANAYGHGLKEVARLFEALRPPGLAVAFLEEGVALREAGISVPVLVMGGLDHAQIDGFLDYNLTMTVSSLDSPVEIETAAARRERTVRLQVKVDTGMGRMGIRPEEAIQLFEAITASPFLEIVAVYSHFATADEPDRTQTEDQIQTFREVVSYFRRAGLPTPTLHFANSGAILQHSASYFDQVRPGIMLYGVYPTEQVDKTVEIVPALTWKSKVVLTKRQPAGCPVSYGATWAPDHDTRIATIPMGYGDGYPRLLSNRGQVLIRGSRYPIVGRVCMDQFVVEIGPYTDVETGDEVVIIGTQGDETITADQVSGWARTIPYEILSGIGERVPRRYTNQT